MKRMTWTFQATIRIRGCHDFVVTIQAPDQIAARRILETKYGLDSIVGNNVTLVGP